MNSNIACYICIHAADIDPDILDKGMCCSKHGECEELNSDVYVACMSEGPDLLMLLNAPIYWMEE